ncbi:hypothetical protein [Cohnella algarum]|uniref:hypothetical protein n=1 Tax=Cohnella algarum TaxID=2044859 RepID=UPI001967285A|nr:hypothetical protein [Cohnella algarum]MBN2979896.1 hypothetical protein [Cohnella algarum]
MSVVICPWCQSEILTEEGQEPEKYCPVCDNELGGYRTLRVALGEEDEPEEAMPESQIGISYDEEPDWDQDEELKRYEGKAENLLDYEEAVEKLLDGQETVPECPQCQEYMLHAGEMTVGSESFRPRTFPAAFGSEAVLSAPFAVQAYVCPSCFTMHYALAEEDRMAFARRLSDAKRRKERSR